ncbi:RNA polymerase sigma factor [Sorangium cellulosum]|uniref:RNA polymerase sigma factor n=1 Tax=Sorangium cellulosum TaxID=56 RepID=UPI0004120EC2|nr:RNA polymerase sigma factor [Sorangium cellulosum]
MEPSHAFMAAIAGEHFSFIARYLARLGVRAQDIEDVAQEVLAGAYRALPRFDASRGSVRSWLMGIATHQASNHFRRAHRRRERLRSLDDLAELPDATPDSEQRVIARDRRGVLDQLLAELPMERRCVFVAHEIEEIDMAEIAQQLSIPLSTAWSRHRLAWVDIEAAMRRWQARQRGRALAFIPFSAGALVQEARADREVGRSLLARVGRALSPRRLAGASASRSAALHAVVTAAAPLAAAAAAIAIAIGALRADASLVAADARASTAPAVAAVVVAEAQAPTPAAPQAASSPLAAVAAPEAQAAAPPSPAGAAPPHAAAAALAGSRKRGRPGRCRRDLASGRRGAPRPEGRAPSGRRRRRARRPARRRVERRGDRRRARPHRRRDHGALEGPLRGGEQPSRRAPAALPGGPPHGREERSAPRAPRPRHSRSPPLCAPRRWSGEHELNHQGAKEGNL